MGNYVIIQLSNSIERNQNMDIRVRNTRSAVRSALIEIMVNEKYENITISKLCEVAEISRKTFYLHYASLNEVIKDIGEDFYSQVHQKFKSKDNSEYTMRNVIYDVNYILKNNMTFYYKMANSPSHHEFHMALEIAFQRIVSDVCKTTYGITSQNLEYYSSFYASGVISIYGKWFRSNEQRNFDELYRIVERCCFIGADGFLKESQNK